MPTSETLILTGMVATCFNVTITIVVTCIMWNLQGPTSIRRVSDQPSADRLVNEDPGCCETLSGSRNLHAERKTPNPYLDHSRGLLDQSGHFMTHPFAITGEDWDGICDSWRICLSTQTSADLMFNIGLQAEMWEGPLSVSVLTPDRDFTVAIIMIKYLLECFPKVRSRVAFHITYPRDLPPKYVYNDDEERLEYDCKQPEAVNREIVKKIRPERLTQHLKKAAYPQNLLRNLARQGCPSEYSFTPDIDMISAPGMSRKLNEFVSRNSTRSCDHCAYIIPTYEIRSGVENPRTKGELRALLQSKKAQRFHIKVFHLNQHNSQLKKWETEPSRSRELGVMYNISSWTEFWEPVYVARADVPLYDERFVGYGYTRSSQIFEMHEAGYTWHMLNNAFLCHSGFQTRRQRTASRRKQMRHNDHIYGVFKKEIHARYTMDKEESTPAS